jgi:hypothetical protein
MADVAYSLVTVLKCFDVICPLFYQNKEMFKEADVKL